MRLLKTMTMFLVLTTPAIALSSPQTVGAEDVKSVTINAKTFNQKEMLSPVSQPHKPDTSKTVRLDVPVWDAKIAKVLKK